MLILRCRRRLEALHRARTAPLPIAHGIRTGTTLVPVCSPRRADRSVAVLDLYDSCLCRHRGGRFDSQQLVKPQLQQALQRSVLVRLLRKK